MSAPPRLSFRLEDQFGRLHDSSELAGRVVVMLGGDRAARELLEAWGPTLLHALAERGVAERVRGYAVVDLRGVPSVLRGMVRGLMPREPELTVLLDWQGELARRHDFAAGRCNVLVADRGGAVAIESEEESLEDARVAALADAIAILAGAPGRAER